MDPYLVITVGNQKDRTSVCHRGGKNPGWYDSFAFELTGFESMIDIVCFDKDTFSADDYLAECHINLEELFDEKKGQRWFPMTRKRGKDGGQLLIDWHYIVKKNKNKLGGGNMMGMGMGGLGLGGFNWFVW